MNIKKLRVERGLSQSEAATIFDMSMRGYQSIEYGINETSYANLIKLADFFNCSVDYLLGHQSSNILQLDSLTPAQHELLKEIKSLSDEQVYSIIGYVARLKEVPINEIIEKIKILRRDYE